MNQEKREQIESIISGMTLEQKVGQTLVIGYVGTVITPEILKRIRNVHPAGVRVGMTMRVKTALHDPYAYNQDCVHRVLRQPKDTVKDYIPGKEPPYCTAEEFCEFLNTMKQEALNSGAGIPLHTTMDMEGDQSCDFMRAGTFYLPSCLGQAETNDPQVAYDCAWATGRQLTALGVNWLHSPVLDTNTEPLNKEIGIRSYGDNAETVTTYGKKALDGFRDANMITTGKHFPGRGHSTKDAHHSLPTIDLSREEMEEHLKPFKALVDAGIPSIMTAHTAYPALDPSGTAATLSKPILTDLLKNEWGFEGVITSDDITMGGIVEKHEVADACIEAINAGCDLILLRDESPLLDDVYNDMVEAARSGRLPEERLDDAIRRTLKVKMDYGLFENGNIMPLEKAGSGIADPKVAEIAKTAAERVLKVMRDEQNLLPLKPETKVLLVEQVAPLHEKTNSQKCHPCCFWERMLKYSENVSCIEVHGECDDTEIERILARVEDADVVVMTNYFDRRGTYEQRSVNRVIETGKPVIVVTNSPFPFTVQETMKTVVCTYGVVPECLDTVAATLYGAR